LFLEQAIVAEEPVRDLALEECRRQGAISFRPKKLKKWSPLDSAGLTPNTKIVGRPADDDLRRWGRDQGAARRTARADRAPRTGNKWGESSSFGENFRQSCILCSHESCRGHRAFAAGCSTSAASDTLLDSFANRAAILEFGAAMPRFAWS